MLSTADPAFDRMLVASEFMRDPYPLLRRLRDEAPVYWSESIGGWILTRYDDVLTTFRQVDPFSNEGRLGQAVGYLPAAERQRFAAFEDHYRAKGLLHSDPPDHTRLRLLTRDVFSPRVIETMRPRIQAIVDELLDRVAASGRMDAIAQLAMPLPATVIAEIFGVPEPDHARFLGWSDHVLAFQGVNRPSIATLEAAQRALQELRAYLEALIDARGREPQDDLLSTLVAAEADGERLTMGELLNTSVTLLVAGHETTRSLLGNALFLFLQDRRRWEALAADPTLLRLAIEETLRFESPVSRQPRLLQDDIELGGQRLRRGQMVFQMLNAANRDPAQFDRPEELDIRRGATRHLAFGNGIHFCLGASLARAEGEIVFRTLLARTPDIRLIDPEPQWDTLKRNSRMLDTLSVAF